MKRYVVLDGGVLGDPLYIAENEQDAARYLDNIQKSKSCGQYERRNSLTLVMTGPNSYKKYEVRAVESWEADEPQPS